MDPVAGAGGPGSRFKGKHSLDSDEEEEDDDGSSKYDILASEDVEGELYPGIDSLLGERTGASGNVGKGCFCLFFACLAWDACVFGAGQEAATLPSEGGVRITPFNLQEEMEEGHFDADGNYFLNREAQIRDSWLDNIDWVWLRGWYGWGLKAASGSAGSL